MDFVDTDFFNVKKFQSANELFNLELKKYSIDKKIEYDFTDFYISTITFIVNLCETINIKTLFDKFSLDNEFVYLKYKNDIRGIKTNIKNNKSTKNKDKRKKLKGFSFSNQITIGYLCSNKDHDHNNPIAIKIFNGGSVNFTGCKNEAELKYIYEKLYKKLLNIRVDFYIEKLNKTVQYNFYKNLKPVENIDFRIEMMFGTLKIVNKNDTKNININIQCLKDYIDEKYKINEIKTVLDNNKQVPLRCYLQLLTTKNNDKDRCPTISIYQTGSINIITINKKKLIQTIDLFRKIIKDVNNETLIITKKTIKLN